MGYWLATGILNTVYPLHVQGRNRLVARGPAILAVVGPRSFSAAATAGAAMLPTTAVVTPEAMTGRGARVLRLAGGVVAESVDDIEWQITTAALERRVVAVCCGESQPDPQLVELVARLAMQGDLAIVPAGCALAPEQSSTGMPSGWPPLGSDMYIAFHDSFRVVGIDGRTPEEQLSSATEQFVERLELAADRALALARSGEQAGVRS